MTTAYVDSSVIVAIAFGEHGQTDSERHLKQFDDLRSSNLLEAEVRAAFLRTKRRFDAQILSGIRWVIPDRSLTHEISRVVEEGYVKGADMWHLATALHMAANPTEVTFVTLDVQQRGVARSLGFRV